MTPRDESYPQLLSLAVHEFRTPASVVGGYLRMLQRDGENPLSERQQRMVQEAERSCARLVGLVAELSDIAKLDAGTVGLAKQELDLFSLINEVAGGVHEPDDRGVHLEVQGAAETGSMRGDATRLKAAFHAIFRAILRERVSPGIVAVVCRTEVVDGRRSAVIVTGDIERVADAYAAAQESFDEKRGGLGLTVPLARRVFEGHGGRLWSPAVDGGRGIAGITLPLEEQGA
jgi:signal transduction histidine kinase